MESERVQGNLFCSSQIKCTLKHNLHYFLMPGEASDKAKDLAKRLQELLKEHNEKEDETNLAKRKIFRKNKILKKRKRK